MFELHNVLIIVNISVLIIDLILWARYFRTLQQQEITGYQTRIQTLEHVNKSMCTAVKLNFVVTG